MVAPRIRSIVRRVALACGALLIVSAVPSPGVADADDPDAWSVNRFNGIPVHWNKCMGIGYRINYERAPNDAQAQIQEAVRRLEDRSGLNFVYRGATTRFASLRSSYPTDTRLVIGWTTPSQSDEMPGGVAGVGGYQYSIVVDDGDQEGVITKGFVQFNASLNADLANGFGRGPEFGYQGTKGQLMMHELGHAVGLQHVGDPDQIMFDTMTRKYARWGRGDENGLKRVGSYRDCVATPPASAATRTVVHAD